MRILLTLFISLWLSVAALAQTGTGTVQGTVTDSSRSAVPNAKVTITHQATNIPRVAETSAVGIYYFASVVPGRYTVSVEATGFKRWTSNFVLEVGQTAVIDPTLEVGAVETTVEVVDTTPIITLGSAEIADVKDAVRIQQLPLNGRSITTLFNLTPGLEGGGNPRVNGLKVGSVEMLLDGISLVDRFGGGIARVQPGVDTIQEFRIETTGSSARYSRPATVTLVTKSGTNSLHGDFFETHRNNRGGLRARARQDGNTPSKLIRNEFGASAGGPVYLPGLYNGRDRSFWFFAFEGLRQRTDTFTRARVPLPEMWEGNFNRIFDNNNNQTNIFDPLTTNAQGVRTQFANNTIPRSRLHSFYDVMRSVSPAPTNANNPFQDINHEIYYNTLTNTDSYTVKGDHRFSPSDSLSGRFTRSRRFFSQVGGRFGSPDPSLRDGFGTGRSDSFVYTASLTHTHIFTPNLFSEVLVAVQRSPHGNGTLADFTDWAGKLGLPNPFGVTGWPTISSSDPFGWDSDNRHNQHLTGYVAEPNFTWIRGKHSFKWGGKVRFEYNNVRELQQAQGSHTFGNAWTANYNPAADQAVSRTGSGLAAMALGLPTFLSNQYNRGYFYFEQQELGLYFHDTWKVSPRLTLDLGVRWDKWTAYEEKYNRLVNVDLDNFARRFEVVTPRNVRMEDLPGLPPSLLQSWARRGLTWRTANDAGLPPNLLPADNNNFGPRIGAAYRLSDRTVLRAGYGEFFWTMPLSQILQTSRTNPPLNLRYVNQIGSLDGTSTFAVRTAPRPEFFVGRATVDTQGIITLPATAQTIMPWDYRDWRDSRAQSWHFTLEREVMRSTALRLSYVGDHGRDLEQRFALNARESEYNYQARTGQIRPSVLDRMRVNPDWNFNAANHTGYSNTHSLQAEVERRYTSGLAFQWFYVFTRSQTTSDAGGFTSGNGNINSTDGQFLVPENHQILGAPNLSYDQRLRLGYQNSANIPAHRIRWNGIYDLPFGRGQKFGRDSGGFLNHLIGGWQIATIGEWRGGNWLSVGTGGYLFGDPTLSPEQRLLLTFNNRPQRLWFRGDFDPRNARNVDAGALQALVPVDRGARVFHPVGANFDNLVVQRLADGTTRLTTITDNVNWNARAFMIGPGAWNVDVAFFKNISITESVKARVTADFFNFFNHPVDGNPNSSTGLQDLSVQANDPRIIQFSLRLTF
jgi:hypothetical protein